MTCLIDLVGLKGLTTSLNGSYVNQLPGITLERLDRVLEQERLTLMGLWRDIETRASAKLLSDFKVALKKHFSIASGCDIEKIICDNKTELTEAFKLLLAIEVLTESIYSSRVNRFTTIDKEEASELKDHFYVEYEKALDAVACFISLEDEDGCLNCSPRIKQVTSLP